MPHSYPGEFTEQLPAVTCFCILPPNAHREVIWRRRRKIVIEKRRVWLLLNQSCRQDGFPASPLQLYAPQPGLAIPEQYLLSSALDNTTSKVCIFASPSVASASFSRHHYRVSIEFPAMNPSTRSLPCPKHFASWRI